MAAASWLGLRLFPRLTSQLSRLCQRTGPLHPGAPVRRVSGTHRARVAEKGNETGWGKSRSPEPPKFTELDKADAWMLRKAHETGNHHSRTYQNALGCELKSLDCPMDGVICWPYPSPTSFDIMNWHILKKILSAHSMSGFLSWFRNGLLATGIGVISYVQSDVGREAAYGFFILGGVCVSFGSASYIGNLFAVRRTMLLSLPAVLLNGLVVSSAALFWLCAVALYIGRLEVEVVREGEEECEDCRNDEEDRDKKDK